MGKQRLVEITAEVGGPLTAVDLQVASEPSRQVKRCPLRVLGVVCSPDVVMPVARIDSAHVPYFPTTNQISVAGNLAMAIAMNKVPVPSSVCCDLPLPSASSPRWY